jgi:hypothetical protein
MAVEPTPAGSASTEEVRYCDTPPQFSLLLLLAFLCLNDLLGARPSASSLPLCRLTFEADSDIPACVLAAAYTVCASGAIARKALRHRSIA